MKKFVYANLAILFAVAFSACGSGEKEEVSLALDWFPNSNHAGIYLAMKNGYFEDENLEVNVYTPSDPASILASVGAGRDDFGISYQPDLLQARSQGVEAVSIAGIVQHPLNSIMTLQASGLETPADLRGKRIGYPGIPSNEGMLETMLNTAGVEMSEVELVDVSFNLVPSLIGGTVDAIVGAYWTHESILAELEGYPVNVIRMEEWGVPDFYELVLVTNEETLAERENTVERFVRALSRGFEASIDDPDAALDALLELGGDEVNEELESQGVLLLVPMWGGDAPAFGWQESSRWVEFTNWMKERGLVEQNLDPQAAFTNEFIE
jgi:putative hydroxymethylpyrimidine transport system substrate-binding protein